MSDSDPIKEYYAKQRAKHAERVAAQQELMATVDYQKELKFIGSITDDMMYVLQLCQHFNTLAPDYSENSLVIQSTVDLAQSVLSRSAE